jgi:transposase
LYYNWEKKLEKGYYDVKIKRERHRKIDKEALGKAVAETPDAFLKEFAKLFNCTTTAIYYALVNLNITRKKDFYLLDLFNNSENNIVFKWAGERKQ